MEKLAVAISRDAGGLERMREDEEAGEEEEKEEPAFPYALRRWAWRPTPTWADWSQMRLPIGEAKRGREEEMG